MNENILDEFFWNYTEKHNIFASSAIKECIDLDNEIRKVLSTDMQNKLTDLQSADAEYAFKCGFKAAMQVILQGVSV